MEILDLLSQDWADQVLTFLRRCVAEHVLFHETTKYRLYLGLKFPNILKCFFRQTILDKPKLIQESQIVKKEEKIP